MMRGIFQFLALAAVCALPFMAGGAALAAGEAPQEEPASVPLLVPTSGWLVGPASLAEGLGTAMPCVMLNQYNNGYNLRFSGANRRILAMAVDFRQDAFRAGSSYELDVSVPPDFSEKVTATALNGGTILINTQKYEGLYEALSKGKSLRISVGGADLDFLLAGAHDGLERVEACRDPQAQEPRRQASAAPGAAEGVASVYVDTLRSGHAPGAENAQPLLPAVKASAGEASIDAMLGGAAEKLAATAPASGMPEISARAGEHFIKAQVQPSEGDMPAENRSAGREVPPGKPLAASWLPPLTPRKTGMTQRDVVVASASRGQTQAAPERRWRAMKGMNLHEILDTWARSEGARVLWQAGRDYAVKDTLGVQGTFEEAVLSAFEQFAGEPGRPVGKIFVDPSAGQKVLVVETASGAVRQ